MFLGLCGLALARPAGDFAVVTSVEAHHLVTSEGTLLWKDVRGVVLVPDRTPGRLGRAPRQVLAPGDRVNLRADRWLEVRPAFFSGAFVDARYGDLLLRGRGGPGLNLIAPGTLDVRLNGLPAKLEELPVGRSAYVRYDSVTGIAGRLEVVDPGLSRPAPDPGRIWEVRAGRGSLRGGQPDRPLRAGEELHLEMKAPPGARGSFDITGLAWDLPAREAVPGSYRAVWPVTPGMDIHGAYVLGRVGGKVRIGPAVSLAASAPEIEEVGPVGTGSTVGPIFARYSSAGAWIDATAVRLRVDGLDVTGRADRRPDVLFYTPEPPLAPGPHRVQLKLADAAGNVTAREWRFSAR